MSEEFQVCILNDFYDIVISHFTPKKLIMIIITMIIIIIMIIIGCCGCCKSSQRLL